MRIVRVRKSGWNTYAALGGPLWYIFKGMFLKGFIMIIIAVCTLGAAIIPIWLYCGYRGNSDFYKHLKGKHIHIY